MQATRHLRTLVESAVERLGYDLVAVEWVSDGRGLILRLSIDAPGGIGADDCAHVSHHVSQLLDEHDPIEGSYTLEVSSPGIDRPLQRTSDFVRFVGYRAKVRLVEGHPRRRFTGVLRGVEGDTVRILVDGQEYTFPVDAVEKAHLVLDLDEYQRLAEGSAPSSEPDEPEIP
jgi:ribosome maturation factor RimP